MSVYALYIGNLEETSFLLKLSKPIPNQHQGTTLKKKILFVDDDEDILFCYSFSLESKNTTVYTASDVNTALDIVRENKIDVAILDYMMPGLKGDELAKEINMIDPGVKIFFISGYDIALDPVKKLNLSVYGTFMKPVDLDLLSHIANTEEYSSTAYQTASKLYGNLYSNVYTSNTPHQAPSADSQISF